MYQLNKNRESYRYLLQFIHKTKEHVIKKYIKKLAFNYLFLYVHIYLYKKRQLKVQ